MSASEDPRRLQRWLIAEQSIVVSERLCRVLASLAASDVFSRASVEGRDVQTGLPRSILLPLDSVRRLREQ